MALVSTTSPCQRAETSFRRWASASGSSSLSLASISRAIRALTSFYDQVHELPGDIELLDEGLAFDPGAHFFGILCGGQYRRLVSVGGNGDFIAQLSVYLHRQFHDGFDELGGIDGRPALASQRFCFSQSLPDF